MWNQDYAVSSVGEYNLDNSSYDPEYPTGPTNKVGHYLYFNAQGDASTCLLNCSNYMGGNTAGDGGFQFHQCSATLNPQRLLKLDTTQVLVETQFKVDKGSSAITYQTVGTFASSPIFIILDTNPSVPPTNWLLGNVYTVQVGNTGTGSPPLMPNTNYYCQYIDTQAIKILSTSDPNSPTLDSSGITSVLIPIGSTSSISNSTLSDTLTLINETDEAILTATNLTFNGTSIPSSISTNQIKQTNTLQVYSSPAIYADGRPPLAVPSSSSNTYAQFGWYFKNTTAGWKINWYMPPNNNMIVSDVLGIYMRLFNCGTTSNDDTPFITVYTKPTGSGDYAPGFFHSSMTYILSSTPTINTSYTFFENVSGTCPDPSYYASSLVAMQQSPVNNPRGQYLSTEQILAFVIGTNSASAVNSVEFIIQKLGIMTASGTTEFLFQTL